MGYLILILLLLAAIFGVLGTVLKVTVILIISVVLAVALLLWLGWWAVKRETRRYVESARTQSAPGPPGAAGSPEVLDAEGRIVRPELPE